MNYSSRDMETLRKQLLSHEITSIFISIFTVFGNSLVLVATWKDRTLHEPNKYFTAALAVADLFIGMFVVPFRINQASNFRKDGQKHSTSIHLCRFIVWMDSFAFTASILTLTFISFDRYLKISKPLRYRSLMTTSMSFKVISIIWFISTVFACYSTTPNAGSAGLTLSANTGKSCFKPKNLFYIIVTNCAFFLPTVVIVIMYAFIFFVVHNRQKMLKNGALGQVSNNRSERAIFLQDLKVIRMLLVVIGIFIICWGPLFTAMLLVFYYAGFNVWFKSSPILETIVYILPLFNSLCNPFIYAWLDLKCRKAFKHLWRTFFCLETSGRRGTTSEADQNSQSKNNIYDTERTTV